VRGRDLRRREREGAHEDDELDLSPHDRLNTRRTEELLRASVRDRECYAATMSSAGSG
jgi:hypothetical protein